ncbi:HPr family phosphocarrier protein [Candidatus Clavichlamydia salmonicola]|uniref:HPr family phosphocarrier protein n=1 Tax=Candidatus Clavichlamydia salmonicola TaxID=469812 RepID=UPI00189155DB|nr:HPr family phosphocarrier protein [Candidatus Clavichlamydia salmonicola]
MIEVEVKNLCGLHVRPASLIARLLQNSHSDIEFTYGKETINAKSILGILMLGAPKNAKIMVTIKGRDAKETMERLVTTFNDKFGEE